MDRETEVHSKIEYFKHPEKLHAPKDLLASPKLVPDARGVYGWYFDILPPGIPGRDYITVNGYMLLYIGIAGQDKNKNGTLRKRIRNHHLGKHTTEQSALRRTLGSHLCAELRLDRQEKGKGKYWYGFDGEARLRDWMFNHAQLAWCEDLHPREIELEFIKSHGKLLPLNKEGQLRE